MAEALPRFGIDGQGRDAAGVEIDEGAMPFELVAHHESPDELLGAQGDRFVDEKVLALERFGERA